MSIREIISSGILTMVAVGSFAAPMVTDVTAMQQFPWENKVYITYKVVGDIAASVGSSEEPLLVITAKDKATGQIYAVTGGNLSGDTGTATGVHKVVWDIGTQGLEVNSDKVTFKVEYRYGYLVVDLSAGADASSYPVSYLVGVPAGGWTDDYKTTKLVLRRIPAGTFKMQNESNVMLTRSFYMGVFEVTQKQYQLVMGSNPSNFKGDTLPVEEVSYNMIRGSADGAGWPSSSAVDATSFMGKLRARTGLDFDLPTEAQWEYACRAGTTTTYYWGNTMDGDYAWYSGNSSSRTHKVGTNMPNAWGLYDMSGNVWEWCLDRYNSTLAYGTDPKGSSSGWNRVARGGGWYNDADGCTSSWRRSNYPSSGNGSGFRLARTLSNE